MAQVVRVDDLGEVANWRGRASASIQDRSSDFWMWSRAFGNSWIDPMWSKMGMAENDVGDVVRRDAKGGHACVEARPEGHAELLAHGLARALLAEAGIHQHDVGPAPGEHKGEGNVDRTSS